MLVDFEAVEIEMSVLMGESWSRFIYIPTTLRSNRCKDEDRFS